jgi:hypothetical protein
MYTRSKTLYLTSKIEKNIIQYIENSQIVDYITFSRMIQNDLSDIIKKNTRYNVQETIYTLEFLYNQYRIRREQNLDYSIVIPIKIVYNADVEWKNNICSICYDKLKRKNIVKTKCGHSYCVGCISTYIFGARFKNITNCKIDCPYCRSSISYLYTNDVRNKETIKYRCMIG